MAGFSRYDVKDEFWCARCGEWHTVEYLKLNKLNQLCCAKYGNRIRTKGIHKRMEDANHTVIREAQILLKVIMRR